MRCKQCMTVLATLTMTEGVLTAGLVEVVPERRSDNIFTHEAAIPAQPLAPITTRIKLATSDFTPCNYVVRCECADGNQKRIHNVSTASLAQLGQVKGRRDFLV